MNLEGRNILVFDIEVISDNFEQYDEQDKDYLLKYATDETSRKNTIESLVFSPFTSSLIAIGLLRNETKREGKVLIKIPEGFTLEKREDNISYDVFTFNKEAGKDAELKAEAELLTSFWNYIEEEKINLYVTFNGREFDCPYVMLRSLILGVKPTQNLMKGGDFTFRDYHIDILKELTFFKHSPTGARRKYNLDFYCKRLGVTSPKAGGVSGDKVGELYNSGEYQIIADYAAEDIIAEAKLFKRINEFLI